MNRFLIRIAFLLAFYSCDPVFAGTIDFRMDTSSFSKEEIEIFQNAGYKNDPQPFHNTYILPQSTQTAYAIYRVTPVDEVELAFLMQFVGEGLEIYREYKGEAGKPTKDNSDKLAVRKKEEIDAIPIKLPIKGK